MKKCEHCGAEHKSSVVCGWFKDKPDWYIQQGFDPPCSMDEYDEGQRELRRRELFEWVFVIMALVMLVSVLVRIFGGR